jgi:uncharacterized membrane protein
MMTVPDWLIYSLICYLLYGFWGFFGNLATKYVDYKTAFFYEAIGAILMTLFILIQNKSLSFQGDVRGILFAVYWGFVRDNRSDTFGLLKYLRSDYALLSRISRS